MVTGEAVFVPLVDWMPYSPEVALELARDRVANSGGFCGAMKEMLIWMKSTESTEGALGSSSTSLGRGRARVQARSSNQKLGTENKQNKAAFQAKMFRREDGKLGCKNCPKVKLIWEFGARRHARMCRERPSVPSERSTWERHTCSVAECGARFASLGELHAHYRTQHADRRPYKCPPCQKTFKTTVSHTRHMLEKHPAPGKVVKVHCCSLCDFSTAWEWYIPYHMKRKHREEYDMLMSNKENRSEYEEVVVVEGVDEPDDGVEDVEEVVVVREVDEPEDGVEYVEEVVGGGIVGRLQSQINSLAKRYKSWYQKR